jgi:hypothetical protein
MDITFKERDTLKLKDFSDAIDWLNLSTKEIEKISKAAKNSNLRNPVAFINGQLLYSMSSKRPVLILSC